MRIAGSSEFTFADGQVVNIEKDDRRKILTIDLRQAGATTQIQVYRPGWRSLRLLAIRSGEIRPIRGGFGADSGNLLRIPLMDFAG